MSETTPEYCQQSGQLVTLSIPLTSLCRYILYQQEIDKLLKKISTKVLYTHNMPMHSVYLVKEYQHSFWWRDMPIYHMKSITFISTSSKKSKDIRNQLCYNQWPIALQTIQNITNITPNILFVIPRNVKQLVYTHMIKKHGNSSHIMR